MLNRERKPIDITTNSELLRLVREMESADQPLSLREEDREVAVLVPTKQASKRHTKRTKTKADHDAFLSSAGSWKDIIDADEFIANVYESRRMSTRPPVEL